MTRDFLSFDLVEDVEAPRTFLMAPEGVENELALELPLSDNRLLGGGGAYRLRPAKIHGWRIAG